MRNPNWTATKKEFTFDSDGKETPEKITYEKVQKNWMDFTLKATGAFAIFLPLLLLFIQRCNDNRSENAKAVAQLFTSISTDLEVVASSNSQTPEFSKAYRNILFNYNPRIHLLKDDSLNNIFSGVVTFTKYQSNLLSLNVAIDSLIENYNHFHDYEATEIENKRVTNEEKPISTKTINKCQSFAGVVLSQSNLLKGTFGKKKIGSVSDTLSRFFTDTLSDCAYEAQVHLGTYQQSIDPKYKILTTSNWDKAHDNFRICYEAKTRINRRIEINIHDIKDSQSKLEKHTLAIL